jgi:hypothetical protein
MILTSIKDRKLSTFRAAENHQRHGAGFVEMFLAAALEMKSSQWLP